ncbi:MULTISPECIES: hypothetical protein [Mycobacteroides]|uniref:hypothetical protein n=1 Tax=Mycobacteroides TaxID=670516 RepID=UPI000696B058|nr:MULTISPECIES: hypothetical protein [Mycobacteroides]
MATDSVGSSRDVTALSLQLLGAFHHLQTVLDVVAARFFEKSMPKVAKFIKQKMRTGDVERVDLFLVISSQLETDAELGSFKATFNEVKAMRDSLAHSAAIDAIGQDQLKVVKSLIGPDLGFEPEGSQIGRDEISAAIQKCRWLEMQALYVNGHGMGRQIGAGPVVLKFKRPTEDPESWDGNVFLYGSRPGDES